MTCDVQSLLTSVPFRAKLSKQNLIHLRPNTVKVELTADCYSLIEVIYGDYLTEYKFSFLFSVSHTHSVSLSLTHTHTSCQLPYESL